MKRLGVWIPGLAAALILATSALVSPDRLPGLPLCPLLAATGIPCPGCGMTRAFCAVSHGQFAQAAELNPFVFPLYLAALAALAWPWFVTRRPDWTASVLRSRWFFGSAALFLVSLCGWGALRAWQVASRSL